MPVCESLSIGYFKCLEKLWTNEELSDFTVQIDDVSIKCHRVILGACSPFFLGLLRSGMKEANEGRVVLQDISVSTFQLILKTLYTGEDVLSLDNFIEIWHTVDMLQIGFFINMCETFAVNNLKLDNFEEIYSVAKLLNATAVIIPLTKFILENFYAISETKTFLQFSFEEFLDLVKKRELKASNEYCVLQGVLKWTEYNPIAHKPDTVTIGDEGNRGIIKSERTKDPAKLSQDLIQQSGLEDIKRAVTDNNAKGENEYRDLKDDVEITKSEKYEIHMFIQPDSIGSSLNLNNVYTFNNKRLNRLEDLLQSVRIFLISPSLLVQVLEHPLIKLNDKANQVIVSAILNQTTYFRHGQWPTAGRYRECYEYGNYGIYCYNDEGSFECIDPVDEKWYTLNKCALLKQNVQLVVFDNELYATGVQSSAQSKSKMFVFCDNSWAEIVEMPGKDLLLASNDNYIYVTNIKENVIYRLNPKKRVPTVVQFIQIPKDILVTHVMSYQIYLLFFCTERVNEVEETAVHMLDLQAKSWTKLDNLEGPAENIISFRNDDKHFVLQTNGNLWSVSNVNGKITFTHLAKLWSIKKVMYGAVVYGQILILFGEIRNDDIKVRTAKKLDNIFVSIHYWERGGSCSNFIPTVLPKSGCTPEVIK